MGAGNREKILLGRKLKVRTEYSDRNKVRSCSEGGRMSREWESVFARGSVGADKTEAS